MAKPEVSNCPPGLEYLTQIDQLIVKQQIELFEGMGFQFIMCNKLFTTNFKYMCM